MCGFLFVLFAAFLNDMGLSGTQISFVAITYAASQAILEIPTGALADKFGRKNVLIFEKITKIISLSILLFANNFYGYLISAFLTGLADSLQSGTIEALMYDNMKFFKMEKSYAEHSGKSNACANVAYAVVAFLTAYIVSFGYNYLIIATIIPVIIALLVLITLKDEYHYSTKHNKKDYLKILNKGVRYSFQHRIIFKFLLFWCLGYVIHRKIIHDFYSIFLFELTHNTARTAFLIGITTIASAVGKFTLVKYLSQIKLQNILIFISCASLCFLISSMIFSFYISFALAVIYWGTTTTINTVLKAKQQSFTPSRYRSTITSMRSFCCGGTGIIFVLLFGVLSDAFSYQTGFIIFSAYQLVIYLVFVFVLGKDKHFHKNSK